MKIFVSDYDGTIHRGGKVLPEDLEAITAWKRAGNLFGIASGRDFASLASVWGKTLVCPDFIVGGNGTQIYNGMGNRLLEFSAGGEHLPEIAAMILEWGGKIVHFTVGSQRYILALDGVFPEKTHSIYLPKDEVPRLPKVHSVNTYFDTVERAIAFCAAFNARFGDEMTAMNNTDCGDIVPVGSGKAEGIAAYLELAGLSPEAVITAGDSGNDLGMLCHPSYKGYTLETADEAVRDVLGADRVKPDLKTILLENL